MDTELESLTETRIKQEKFNLHAALERIRHWLPTQGPIKDFVHHNTLHAFQHLPFHDGVQAASHLYGAAGYLDLQSYRRAYDTGRISSSAVKRALSSVSTDEKEREEFLQVMFSPSHASSIPKGIARSGIRSRWEKRGINLQTLVRPLLFKLLSNYLDQGISVWRMPHAHADISFWQTLGRILNESGLPLPPLTYKDCLGLLAMKPGDAILFCLKQLVGFDPLFERYIFEMVLSHPGWSGMVHMVDENPGSLLEKREVSFEEFVALELVLEYGWVSHLLGPSASPVGEEGEHPASLPMIDIPAASDSQKILRVWHEAFEWTFYEDILSSLECHAPVRDPLQISAQVFFCLDDRSESMRRHLEEIDWTIATYGTAGFFGIDFLYQGFEDSYPIKSCPLPVKPRHLVRESREKVSRFEKFSSIALTQPFEMHSSSNTLFRGWLITQTLGLWHSIRLALQVFSPSSKPTREKNLSFVKAHTKLHLLRESDAVTEEGYLLGYSFEEMAERVFGVLKGSGLTKNFADLVVMIGHGSSSANNPHFAAYDCGACSGKPGAPNARAFAWMANRKEVRALLKGKGIAIPDSCYFIAAMQDTCRDEMHYFDMEGLPENYWETFRKFNISVQKAARRNAKERSRRFEMIDHAVSPIKALKKVRERSASIFEPRPELNHATNAVCIVGRRELTRGLFLDRRAFLNSYDPGQDSDGSVLSAVLDAVVPVCGGINLEYYFSRVDNTVYGAGTKLPHNVVSLVGVANGTEGDLRTGLPSQMTEVHDPVRLLLILEQKPEVAKRAVTGNPKVFEWIKNDWVRLACIDPTDKKTYFYEKGEFVRCDWKRKRLPKVDESLEVIEKETVNIPVHEIGALC